jgi:hypothetical protein
MANERKARYEAENAQFWDELNRFGWLEILRQATPLERGIDYCGTKNHKKYDICPDSRCSGHQLWKKDGKNKGNKAEGNFVLSDDADVYGSGYCFKCKRHFKPVEILQEFNGFSKKEAFDEIRHIIGFKPDPNYTPKAKKSKPKTASSMPRSPTQQEINDSKRLQKKMNDAWSQAVFLNDESALPAARYFASRGITSLYGAMKNEMKFHPAMPFYIPLCHPTENKCEEDEQDRFQMVDYCQTHEHFHSFIEKTVDGITAPIMANMGNHPCLLIMVRTKYGEPRRLHRIFLDKDGGKASFAKDGFEVKKMMPGGVGLDVTGCACYIDPVCNVVGVAEGMETVLAVKQFNQMPMDCTINAGGLAQYEPRDGVTHVVIWEDKDASKTGSIVSNQLRERLLQRGIKVVICTPPIPIGNRKSVDWLDVLYEMGTQGFPEFAANWRQLVQPQFQVAV